MICKKCGSQINDNALFCPKCGQKTDNQTQNAGASVWQDANNRNTINHVNSEGTHKKKHTLRTVVLSVVATIIVLFGGLIWIGSQAPDSVRTDSSTVSVSSEHNETSEVNTTESLPSTSGVQPYGDGTTILVYIVGSNLETDDGSATKDIDEMMSAEFGEDIHLIVQTGGAKEWQNSSVDGVAIDNKYIQRYRIKSGEKELIENLELTDMGNAQTLSNFLKWGVDTYPAERYIAIMWNHGGGTVGGYGNDEIYDSTMSLSDVNAAFENTGYHFDMIGFDACLMATLETAYALSDYADYLLASEETEWGYGWYYTDWLTLLGSNLNMSTEDLGKKIIDDYAVSIENVIKAYDTNEIYTLSLMDLTKLDETYSAILNCFDEANRKIASGGFSEISYARLDATHYGGGDERAPGGLLAQIDIMDFLTKAGLITDQYLTDIICGENGFVVYEKNNYPGSNGIAMYFPFIPAFEDYMGSYDRTSKVLKSIGYEDSYFKFFDSFMSVLADINDLDFTPQYSGDSAETDLQTAISSNSYTGPVLDEDGLLPIVKDESGYYKIDLSVQPEEFVNNIASIWSSTYIGEDEYLWHIMTTPGINEVGHDNYISYGGLSMRPYPYEHMVAGTLTSLNYLCKNNMGETYYITARVNGEEAAIIIDSRFTFVPNHTTGEVVPSTKVWHYRGYTTSFDEGVPNIRSLRDFKAGDQISSMYRTIDGVYYESTESVTFDSIDNLAKVWNYGIWPSTSSSCVVNTVIDTSGKCYYAYAFYPSSDGKYSDYYDQAFSTQHLIEGN